MNQNELLKGRPLPEGAKVDPAFYVSVDDFPTGVHHRDGSCQIVHNQRQLDNLLADGWKRNPAEFAGEYADNQTEAHAEPAGDIPAIAELQARFDSAWSELQGQHEAVKAENDTLKAENEVLKGQHEVLKAENADLHQQLADAKKATKAASKKADSK